MRTCGNFEDAEDLCQDVLLTALVGWEKDGLPMNPLAWLFTTARNRTTDRFRQQTTHRRIHSELADSTPEPIEVVDRLLEDDLLRLIFTCCHPAIATSARVQLTLKSVTGLSLDEVARAFLIQPRALEQRLLRELG